MLCKFKPVWQFQSVEFDYEVNNSEDLQKALGWFAEILEGLQAIAPEQQKQYSSAAIKRPASQGQLQTLRKYRIPFKPNLSYDEADALIKENMARDEYMPF